MVSGGVPSQHLALPLVEWLTFWVRGDVFDKVLHLALVSIETQVSTPAATDTFGHAFRGQENAVYSLYLDRLWQVK